MTASTPIITLTPTQTAAAIRAGIRVRRPVFIWGAPGIGKSQVAAQVAAEEERELRDVRLGQMDVTEIKGFPIPDLANELMRWLPPDFLPPMMVEQEVYVDKAGKRLLEDGDALVYEDGSLYKSKVKPTMQLMKVPNESKGLLFLDELNQAPAMVQTASYQLLLDHKVGSYTLPKNWAIIAAGNRETDRSNAQRMPAALALRLIHIDMVTSPDDWCDWAVNQGRDEVPVELLAFIRFRPDLLHAFDPKRRVSPNPRGWVFCGSLQNDPAPAEVKFAMMAGTVGEGEAGEYKAFADTFAELPSIDQIKIDPDGTPIPEKPGTLFAITAALAAATTKDVYPRLKQYVDRMDPEWQVVYTRDAMRRTDRAICTTKEFQNFAVKHSSLLS